MNMSRVPRSRGLTNKKIRIKMRHRSKQKEARCGKCPGNFYFLPGKKNSVSSLKTLSTVSQERLVPWQKLLPRSDFWTSVTFSWKQRRVRESWKSRLGWENWCSENPRTWRTGINSFWRTFQPWGGRIWQILSAWRQILSSKDDPWWASVLWNLIFMIIEFFYGSDIYLSDKIYKCFTSLFLLPLKNELI